MKNKNLFFSLALFSALGGVKGTATWATNVKLTAPMSTATISTPCSTVCMSSKLVVADIAEENSGIMTRDGGDATTPVDYSSVMYDPGFEEDAQQYWIYYANGKGTLERDRWKLDYDVDNGSYINFSTRYTIQNPAEGTYYADVWAGRLKALDMYQTVKGLPSGRYRVSARLRNIDANVPGLDGGRSNYLSDQHVYAQVDGVAYDSSVMSEVSLGEGTDNWEELTTEEFVVLDDSTEVRIGVRSTGNGSDQTGWFQVDDFRIVRTGDATAGEISAFLKEILDECYSAAKLRLDSASIVLTSPYDGIVFTAQSLVDEMYRSVETQDSLTEELCTAVTDSIRKLIASVEAGEKLVKRVNECEGSLTGGVEEVELTAALEEAKALASSGLESKEVYDLAYEELSGVFARYLLSLQNPKDWNFNETVIVGDYYFYLDKIHKVARVNSYYGRDEEVVVPEKIRTEDGTEYIVVGVGGGRVSLWQENVKSVKLPITLSFINDRAFNGCSGLKTIELPQLLDSIGSEAFKYCDSLQNIVFPAALRVVGDHAFDGCSSLTKIIFPDEMAGELVFDEYAFSNCVALQQVSLPTGLVSMDDRTFYGCSALPEITLPATLKTIGIYAFDGCSSLTKIIFPDEMAGELVFDEYAFSNCVALQQVSLPTGLVSMDDRTFYGCSVLPEITLPATLKTIGNYVFDGCSALTKVVIPETSVLTTLGNYVFNKTKLKELVLPASLISIGQNIFSSDGNGDGLQRLTVNAPVPPEVLYSLGDGNFHAIYVPQGTGAAYRAAEIWKDYIIVEGEGVNLTIDVDTPGTLGKKILAQTTDMADVNYLTLTGSLDEDDIYNIQDRLTSLLEIDMAGVDMTSLPADMFKGRNALEKIVLPANLQSIGQNALYGCSSLDSISLPHSLRTIGSYAFYGCYQIRKMIVPEGVTEIGNSAFYNCVRLEHLFLPSTLSIVESNLANGCDSLKTVVLPEGITEINNSAFYGTNLRKVTLPSTLTSLGSSAFGSCKGLTSIVLPERLTACATAFSGCTNLKEVTSLALIPPALNGNNNPLGTYGDLEDCTLYVPEIALVDYKLTEGWDDFTNIQGIGYMPQDIQVYKAYEWELPDTLSADYKPDLTLTVKDIYSTDGYGNLLVSGAPTLSLQQFGMTYDPNIYYQYYSNEDYPSYNALVVEAPMRADSVNITVYNKSDRWLFLSFPFDVKVADIVPLYENTSWVIRKYSGEARAAGSMEETWQDMTTDSVLQAGVGYIWQSTRPDADYCGFLVPAINNIHKNQIFANEPRSVVLKEYQAEFGHNRSWNLVGNPFPCFYDIRFMGFTAPITVWNERDNTYEAYSPVDDSFILRPGEAFFVQRPVDMETIKFPTEGRQVDRLVREMPMSAEVNAQGPISNGRKVFNLTLTDGQRLDRTRFVLNEMAKIGYDMSTDAGKFMSPDASVSQLYTMEDGVELSINERPLGNGLIALGAYFGCEGIYTISLDTKADTEVWLVDKLTGTETNLCKGEYTFQAEVGKVTDRFVVKVVDHEVSDEGTTGMDGMSAQDVNIVVAKGQIQVKAPAEAAISVYTMDGKTVGSAVASQTSFEVRPGIYMVTVDGVSCKVTVIE